jgi:hypothetical protein
MQQVYLVYEKQGASEVIAVFTSKEAAASYTAKCQAYEDVARALT